MYKLENESLNLVDQVNAISFEEESVIKSIFGDSIGEDLLEQQYYYAYEIEEDNYLMYRYGDDGERVKEHFEISRSYDEINDSDNLLISKYDAGGIFLRKTMYQM